MFKKLFAALLLLVFFIACKKDCPDCKECPKPDCLPHLDSGLLAYYPFNGNFNDASGNGNDGVPMNGAFLTSDYLGRANKAAGFDGVDDYIAVTDNGKLNPGEITISLQAMVNHVDRRQVLINRNNFDNVSGIVYGISQIGDSPNQWNFGVRSNTEDCSAPATSDPGSLISATSTTEPGRWYSIITSFSGGVQKIYIDGKLEATLQRNFTTMKKCNSSQVLIGGWWKNDIISLDGKIDEIRIYNRGISDCEVKELASVFLTNGSGK